MSHSSTYIVWQQMKHRIYYKGNTHYKDYGGRGIKICPEWNKFENFLRDMGGRPPNKTLDRIDYNGNYEPNNCRWATKEQQCYNMRNNIIVEYEGRRVNLLELEKITGIPRKVLYRRICIRKWPLKIATTLPVQTQYRKYKNQGVNNGTQA